MTSQFPTITSTSNFQAVVLEWLNEGKHCGDTEPEINAFVEWVHEESESWMEFDEWEAFCMANDMA